ncbi:MAG: peptidoglycan DD-metalloendopeptidase family protein [Tannerella sp.]|jgi:septal ring factor EnvC (AmiA/AmiB activator)|nr:peptidoglycan DD-metalloendopeptidase family protein [Tannerella sp.]
MKRLYLLLIMICCVSVISDAQTKKKAAAKSKTPAKTTAAKAKPQDDGKKVAEIKAPVVIVPIEELERQRNDALEDIKLTTQLLSETKSSAANSLNRLNLLAQQLLSRRRIVSLLEQEVVVIDLKIKSINNEIEILEKDLQKIKENYAKSMQTQQQEHRTAQYKMLLILSAENLSQSYRRMRYLKEYSNWQKDEANRIILKQSEINKRKTDLQKSRGEKMSLIAQRTEEGKKIEEEEVIQQKEVSELSKKQKALQSELQQKQKNAKALDNQIDKLIAEDIKKSEQNLPATTPEPVQKQEPEVKKDVAETNTETPAAAPEKTEPAPKTEQPAKKPSSKGTYVLTESESGLSKDFAGNKGKLPYPVTGKHTIVLGFGEHQHRELSHVRTNNSGIDIQTTAGTDAQAIFKGVVTMVFVMPGYNYNVIIRHGDYLTVYSNISQVYVKAGDIVNTRQPIGKIYTDTEKGNETILHFQIWKDRTKLNPAPWIR